MATVYRIIAVTSEGMSKDGTKPYKVCTLENPEGGQLEKVKFWAWKMKDMWNRVTTNGEVEGAIDNDPKWGASFEPFFAGTYNRGTSKAGGIAQAQERKEQSIYASQERKSEDIRISSTARDATLILTALMAHGDHSEWKTEWVKIRAWLYKNWDNKDGYPDDVDPKEIPF